MDFADVEMADALAEMPQEAKANVFRFSEADATWKWVGQITPPSANHDYFARRWGGGKYKARFRKPGNQGWGRQFTLEIDPSIRPESVENTATGAIVDAPRRGGDEDDGDFRSLYKMELLDLIRASRDARTESAASSAALLKMVMDMMNTSAASTAALIKSMTDVRASQPAPAPGLSTADVLKMVGDARREAMELVNAIRGGGAIRSGGNTVDATLDIIERLGDIRERLDGAAGEPKKEGGLFDKLLGDVVPLLLDVLKPALTARPADPGSTAALPAPHGNGAVVTAREVAPATVVPPSPAAIEAPAAVSAPVWLSFVKTSLLEAAQEGRQPEELALSIMDMAPKAFHGKLREFVMQENPVAAILEAAPELKDYPTWLGGLVVELREQFAPPPVDEKAEG